jgi:hypothetical protein
VTFAWGGSNGDSLSLAVAAGAWVGPDHLIYSNA